MDEFRAENSTKTALFHLMQKKCTAGKQNAFAVHGYANGIGQLNKWDRMFGSYFGIMKRLKAVGYCCFHDKVFWSNGNVPAK